ncbi:hypothetical protein HY484_04475 [Candidatus Woesearchaeota archaeon]|nr:hypothetical protein [Candidatus Woesearchaeota archaeon]
MSSVYKLVGLEQHIIEEIESNLTAVASVLSWGKSRDAAVKPYVCYASSPITTGCRMYSLFREHNVSNIGELAKINPDFFKNKILRANIDDGEEFGSVVRQSNRYDAVVVPATFFAKGWAQEHYMAFWEEVIKRFSDAIHFNDNWQYSNGCVDEFRIGLENGKELYEGLTVVQLNPKTGLEKIKCAIEEVSSIGADVKSLYNPQKFSTSL